MAKRFPTPSHGLSVRHLDSEARNIDWGDVRGEYDDGYSVILPDPTYGDWQERDSNPPARIARRSARSVMNDDDRAEFEQTEAHDEWRDSFEPMMNYAWPVSLAYGVGLKEAVALIERHAGACSVIELSDEAGERLYGDDAPDYIIALTGGGMNLSDHIAAAYLAFGCIPPERVLSGLAGVISKEKARRIPLQAAYREASKHYALRGKRLREQARRVSKGEY